MNLSPFYSSRHFLIGLLLVVGTMCSSRNAIANVAQASAATNGATPSLIDMDRDPDDGLPGFPFLSYSAGANVSGASAFALVNGFSGSTQARAQAVNTIGAHPDYPHDSATATVSHADTLNIISLVPGLAYYGYFDVQVHGSLTGSGSVDPSNQASNLAWGNAGARLGVSVRGNFNQFVNDHQAWQASGPQRTTAGIVSSLYQDVPINFTNTYQLPLYFTSSYLIGIDLESTALVYLSGLLTPASNLPHGSADSNLADTVRWGNLRVTDINGNPVPFTVTSESGYDWTQPIVPEGSSLVMALIGGVILLGKSRRGRRK